QLRPGLFVRYFQEANRRLRSVDRIVRPTGGPGIRRLDEDALNELLGDGLTTRINGNAAHLRQPRFFLRADHVYFTARMESALGSYQSLTIGQTERAGPTRIQLRIEAIYIDGLPVDPGDPDVQREIYENELLVIYGQALDTDTERILFEQNNGYLLIELAG